MTTKEIIEIGGVFALVKYLYKTNKTSDTTCAIDDTVSSIF